MWTPLFSFFKREKTFVRVDCCDHDNIIGLDDTARFSNVVMSPERAALLAAAGSAKDLHDDPCFFEGVDASFAKYVTIVKHVLQVPMAAVVLCGDVHLHDARVRRLSGATVHHQASSPRLFVPAAVERFYVTLPDDQDDVAVINNCRDDKRANRSSVVVGPPYVKFYAGVALFVSGVKVGALIVADRATRSDFSVENKHALLGLGAAAAAMMQERVAATAASNNDAGNEKRTWRAPSVAPSSRLTMCPFPQRT